jgi:uncharacterized protein YdeI (YjbR/CyaY-like superfamily)
MEKDIETFSPQNSQEWRKWLEENHSIKNSIWLIYYKKKSKIPSIEYNEAVDQALCFGWIDSKSKPIDDEKYMQFFSKRKPKSVWSKINKNKIERLTSEGLMSQAGLDIIQIAKENGSWFILDDAESLIIPQDLSIELDKNPLAKDYFINLSRSNKRNILQWLVLAKRAETRQNRIKEIVDLANLGRKPKQFG